MFLYRDDGRTERIVETDVVYLPLVYKSFNFLLDKRFAPLELARLGFSAVSFCSAPPHG